MGVSNPEVGYNGYAASNNTLIKDVTEYLETYNSFKTKIYGTWLSDVGENSTLRFKVDMTSTGGNFVYVRLLIDGNSIHSFSTNNIGYVSKTYDIDINWRRGVIVEIQGMVIGVETLKFKNVEFAGNISPVAW